VSRALPEVLAGPRLDLVLVTVDQVLSRHGARDPVPLDWDDPYDVLNPTTSPIGFRIPQVQADPDVNPWLIRLAILRGAPGVIVGLGNFHDAPDGRGMVEIGYQVLPAYRGQGFGREIANTMWHSAAEHPDVAWLRATVSPDNDASLAIVRGAGFVHVGEQHDPEDGLELIFEISAADYLRRPRP
jgi:[ribosomal protein S5]-alanine N-acetyltransferase